MSGLSVPAGAIAVTGARGFIGRRLCRDLAQAGYEILAADLRPALWPGAPRVTEIVGDVGEPAVASLIANYDTVLHLAGLGGVAASRNDPAPYWERNVETTRRLFDQLATSAVRRVVLFSSSSVYGPSDVAASEDTPPRPQSPYGDTKLAAERLAFELAGLSGASVIVLRPFSVYGAGQRPDMALSRLITAAHQRLPFVAAAPPSTIVRDWTYVGDVSVAVRRLLETDPTTWPQVLNVASGRPVGLTVLARIVEELVGPVRWEVVSDGPVRHVAADVSRLRSVLPGFEPLPIREGVARQTVAAGVMASGREPSGASAKFPLEPAACDVRPRVAEGAALAEGAEQDQDRE
jgi:nucleoside-diphosphate-sugar epimerase